MEIVTIDSDIKTFYVQATSFPAGVLEAHQKLHAMIPFSTERKYFGVSRPEDGKISYKAAAEEMNEVEAKKLNLETFIIKRGKYISIIIIDFMKDISAIGKAFEALIKYKDIDPNGYCVEYYLNKTDVQCMIKLK